ncbi:MAG: IPT/TIG domain-containing protein, partial [Candidatus Dormibacteraeota bacterium]|nr:IPT/TIG domain-containing protein [Candidatus Dormibacteraeota bacterium]
MTPNVGPGNNLLTAVTAIGPGDVWAVGFWRPGGASSYAQPLTEHWNGNGWTVIPTPNVPNALAPLYGVSADAASDVWTVGISEDFPVQPSGPKGHALAMHWDGSNWSTVQTAAVVAPIAGPGIDLMGLNAVTVLSPTNAWAVGDGQDYTGSSPSSVDMAFIEHWNGISWSQVTAPVHYNGDFLIDVQGTATDLWAVGGQNQTYGSKEDYVLTEHWTSVTNTWTDVPGATPEQTANLFGLGYLAGNNIYAVGASGSFSPGPNPGTFVVTDHTLVERWDGATWTQLPSPNVGTSDALTSITAISASDLWAAGFSVVNGYAQTLTENYCSPPAVTNVAPSSGNPGSTVVITGTGFTKAIDVEFGTTPAFSFHVDSDTQITASAPGHKAGTVDITVTVQGTSPTGSADRFTYMASRSGAAGGSGKPFPAVRGAPPPLPSPSPPHPRGIARGAPIPI